MGDEQFLDPDTLTALEEQGDKVIRDLN